MPVGEVALTQLQEAILSAIQVLHTVSILKNAIFSTVSRGLKVSYQCPHTPSLISVSEHKSQENDVCRRPGVAFMFLGILPHLNQPTQLLEVFRH